MGKGTEELTVREEGFVTKGGLYKLDTIRASQLGALDYRFNGKGLNKKNKVEFFTAQGMDLADSNGELLKEIEMHIVGFEFIDCTDVVLFHKDHASTLLWCEILFLDRRNVLSSIFIKGHSLDNLKTYSKKLQLLGDVPKSPNEVVTKAKAVEIEGAYGLYYVLDFEEIGTPNKEVVKELEIIFDDGSELGKNILKSAPRYPHSVQIIPRSEIK